MYVYVFDISIAIFMCTVCFSTVGASLASPPGLLRGGGGEGLVSTVHACTCAVTVIVQFLNNPIMY